MENTHRARSGGSWRFLLGLGGLVVLMIAIGFVLSMLRNAIDPMARAQAEYAAMRQQDTDTRLDWLDTLVAAGWRALPLFLVAGAGVVGLIIAYRRWAAVEIIRADKVTALTRAATAIPGAAAQFVVSR